MNVVSVMAKKYMNLDAKTFEKLKDEVEMAVRGGDPQEVLKWLASDKQGFSVHLPPNPGAFAFAVVSKVGFVWPSDLEARLRSDYVEIKEKTRDPNKMQSVWKLSRGINNKPNGIYIRTGNLILALRESTFDHAPNDMELYGMWKTIEQGTSDATRTKQIYAKIPKFEVVRPSEPDTIGLRNLRMGDTSWFITDFRQSSKFSLDEKGARGESETYMVVTRSIPSREEFDLTNKTFSFAIFGSFDDVYFPYIVGWYDARD